MANLRSTLLKSVRKPSVPSSWRTILRNVAASSDLSREKLAAKAGLSRKGLYNLLSGDGDPQLSSVEALAHALGLELVLAPKSASPMQLDKPPLQTRSYHSRINRFMAEANHSLLQSRS